VVDLDNAVQPLRNLTGCEVVPMSRPEATAARGSGVMANSIAGEKFFHVRVRNFRFQPFDVEAGVSAVDASRAQFPLDLETGPGHWKRISGIDQKPLSLRLRGLWRRCRR
jgi:hypothetical protein